VRNDLEQKANRETFALCNWPLAVDPISAGATILGEVVGVARFPAAISTLHLHCSNSGVYDGAPQPEDRATVVRRTYRPASGPLKLDRVESRRHLCCGESARYPATVRYRRIKPTAIAPGKHVAPFSGCPDQLISNPFPGRVTADA
jgi:hypothetical protein